VKMACRPRTVSLPLRKVNAPRPPPAARPQIPDRHERWAARKDRASSGSHRSPVEWLRQSELLFEPERDTRTAKIAVSPVTHDLRRDRGLFVELICEAGRDLWRIVVVIAVKRVPVAWGNDVPGYGLIKQNCTDLSELKAETFQPNNPNNLVQTKQLVRAVNPPACSRSLCLHQSMTLIDAERLNGETKEAGCIGSSSEKAGVLS
jgi:hypothetical protein